MKKTSLTLLAVGIAAYGSLSYAQAQDGHWLVRARAIGVVTFADSNMLYLSAPGGRVNSISNTIVPELDISYFFTPYFSTELILATSHHHVAANDTSLGRVDLGQVSLLPPTLTFQYHFLPEQAFNPYVGAGVNYTFFYNASTGPTATAINYGSSMGPALQAGIDYAIDKNWSLNFDIKKIFMESQVNAYVPALTRDINTHVKINPVIIGLGIGYRFG